MNNVLQHLAIIMDGNRRWATEKGLPKMLGHTEGAKNLKKIAEAVKKRKIPYLTLFALSTENLKNRNEEELKHLFSLFEQLTDYLKDFFDNDVRLNIIGDLHGLPEKTRSHLEGMIEKTKNNQSLVLTLAINYGGRDEIVRAVQKIIQNKTSDDQINEESISQNLDTYPIPDVDLVIRTAGEQRLSGFLAWQTTYAELYFTKIKWPAFSENDLEEAINWFLEQKRNGGK